MNPYESGAIIDMNAARKTVPTPVDADASIEQCTLGVGDGTGSLFVHGSYEAIKRVQAIIHENERMRRTNAAAKAETATSRLEVEMNNKTEQALTAVLRLAAKSAAPYGTAMIGVSHLSEAADAIDNLRAENESLREQRNRIGLCIDRALNGGKKDDHEAGLSGRMDAIRSLKAQLAEAHSGREGAR